MLKLMRVCHTVYGQYLSVKRIGTILKSKISIYSAITPVGTKNFTEAIAEIFNMWYNGKHNKLCDEIMRHYILNRE